MWLLVGASVELFDFMCVCVGVCGCVFNILLLYLFVGYFSFVGVIVCWSVGCWCVRVLSHLFVYLVGWRFDC